jgi:hypothetical protein
MAEKLQNKRHRIDQYVEQHAVGQPVFHAEVSQ